MLSNKIARIKVPKILIDKRKPGYADDIQKRGWGRNKLGQAFVKKPEQMRLSKFYSSGEMGSTEEYKTHKLLEQKILHLLKARQIRPYGLTFYKGNSGAFYVRLKGISSDKSVYIRVDNKQIREAIKFLFK